MKSSNLTIKNFYNQYYRQEFQNGISDLQYIDNFMKGAFNFAMAFDMFSLWQKDDSKSKLYNIVDLYLLDGYVNAEECFHCVCLLVDRLIKNTKSRDAQLSKLDKTLELLKTCTDETGKILKNFLLAVREEISNDEKMNLIPCTLWTSGSK